MTQPETPRYRKSITSPRVKKRAPAYLIIVEKFGGLSVFSQITGFAVSTAHHWLRSGLIPAKWLEPGLSYYRHIIHSGRPYGIDVLPEDFIERE